MGIAIESVIINNMGYTDAGNKREFTLSYVELSI